MGVDGWMLDAFKVFVALDPMRDAFNVFVALDGGPRYAMLLRSSWCWTDARCF